MPGYRKIIADGVQEHDPDFDMTPDHARHLEAMMRIEHSVLDHFNADELKLLAVDCHRQAVMLGPDECEALAEIMGIVS